MDVWEVEAARGHVRREEDCVLLRAVVRVRGEALHLLLPAVQAEERDARPHG